MFIQLTTHKHNLRHAVNPDHIIYVEPVINNEGERSNVLFTNGHSLQVKETAQEIADMVNITFDEIRIVSATPDTLPETPAEPVVTLPIADIPPTTDADEAAAALANAAAAHVASQDKPGNKRETK